MYQAFEFEAAIAAKDLCLHLNPERRSLVLKAIRGLGVLD
jgi:hypothetical protein